MSLPRTGFPSGSLGRSHRLSLALRLLLLLLLLYAALYFFELGYFKARILPGIYLKDLHLGGLALPDLPRAARALSFTFIAPGGEALSLSLQELGIQLDYEAIYREARRRQNHLYRPWTWAGQKYCVPLRYRLDEQKLHQRLKALAEEAGCEPVDAFFRVSDDYRSVEVVPEKSGYRIKAEALPALIRERLDRAGASLTIPLPAEPVPARVAAESLEKKGVCALMSSFTTAFNPAQEDRAHNIKLAAGFLDGYLLAPGERFSLNDFLGESTPEKGYRKAPVISGLDFVAGYGGGLCQISSTLYNAVLLADLEVCQRHNHNLAVPYIAPGRDATISYGVHDFVFRNNKEHHILISAAVEENRLTFRLYGLPPEVEVKIWTHILEATPPPVLYLYAPDLAPGKEEIVKGSFGYRVETWKYVHKGNRLLSRERISLDYYAPYPTKIRRGPPRAH
ncbi:MAG TPA: VanW family protein [Bacillota bacterium]|nr:VanW family protein [Bacillota bacterium]